MRFFSVDANTSGLADSSVGLLTDSSAVVSKSPLASTTGASVFSSSALTGSLTSSTAGADSTVSLKCKKKIYIYEEL